MSSEIQCPKCGSTQLTANKKGYSLTKGAVGVVLTGGIGLLGGLFGSSKVEITCLACGKKFKPGEGEISSNETTVDTDAPIYLFPELRTNENTESDSDISEIILEDSKKEALFAEFNSDFFSASDNWSLYLHDMMNYHKECDLKAIEKAINCYRKTNNVISEFFLYEDLITNYPEHPDIEIWKNSMEELKPMMSSK